VPESEQWYRIIAMCTSRPAPEYPSCTHQKTGERAMKPEGLEHKLGTGRYMPAGRPQERGYRIPVKQNRKGKQKCQYPLKQFHDPAKITNTVIINSSGPMWLVKRFMTK
jgi:hypothetical protein